MTYTGEWITNLKCFKICQRQVLTVSQYIRLAYLAQQAMSGVLFSLLIVCAVITALSLFGLQTNDWISYDTVVSVYEMFGVVVAAFIYCYLSSHVTTYLLDASDIFIYDCKWFMLPAHQQKLIILPMQRAQREFYFNGLGMINQR